MTTTQETVLKALHAQCKGELQRKIATTDIAYRAGMNNLAVSSALNALVSKGLVRVSLISNASVSGGAYKNGYSITFRGRQQAILLVANEYWASKENEGK